MRFEFQEIDLETRWNRTVAMFCQRLGESVRDYPGRFYHEEAKICPHVFSDRAAIEVYAIGLRPYCRLAPPILRFRLFGDMRQYFEYHDAYMHPGDVLDLVPIQVVPPPEPALIEPTAEPVDNAIDDTAEDSMDDEFEEEHLEEFQAEDPREFLAEDPEEDPMVEESEEEDSEEDSDYDPQQD